MSANAGELFAQLQRRGAISGCRGLLFVSGHRDWCYQQAASLAAAVDRDCDDLAVLSDQPLAGVSPVSAKSLLGQERSLVLVDAWTHLSFDDWLAAAGTLRAGGVLCILCPLPEAWPEAFLSLAGDRGYNLQAPNFITRFAALAQHLEGALWWRQGADLPTCPDFSTRWQPEFPSLEQRQAIAAIERVVNGRAWRPLVIRSDRGRGKTAALGIAAAQLLISGRCQRIAVCAARQEAVQTAFKHAAETAGVDTPNSPLLTLNGAELRYCSAQELIDGEVDCDLLMIDEAAMLPVSLLQQCLHRYPRLVYATTVHGYEGSGRGFDIRFKAILDNERPQWRRQFLTEPLRWSKDDPLESTLNRLFLLDADGSESPPQGRISVRPVATGELCREEDLLRQVFGLLVEAHYQTRPQDLQYLLDLPGQLFVAEAKGRVLGVCHVLLEGEMSAALSEAVSSARRRPRGHLVAQRLSNLWGDPCCAELPSWRIDRIAVAAVARQRGVGRALLSAVEEAARGNGVAYLSSSFGAEAGLLDFWRECQFIPLSLGHRRDASSGEYSAIVARALTGDLEPYFARQRHDFCRNLLLQLIDKPGLDVAVVERLLLAEVAKSPAVEPTDIHLAGRYLDGELTLADAKPALWRLCVALPPEVLQWPVAEREAAMRRVLLGQSWATISRSLGMTGRAEVESVLRQFFDRLLSTMSTSVDSLHKRGTST